jgi:hypothetical protein
MSNSIQLYIQEQSCIYVYVYLGGFILLTSLAYSSSSSSSISPHLAMAANPRASVGSETVSTARLPSQPTRFICRGRRRRAATAKLRVVEKKRPGERRRRRGGGL